MLGVLIAGAIAGLAVLLHGKKKGTPTMTAITKPLTPVLLIPGELAVNILRSGPMAERYVSQGPGTGRKLFLHSGADFPGVMGEVVQSMMAGTVVGVYVHRAPGVHEEVSGKPELVVNRLGKFHAPYGFGLYVIVRHGILINGLPLHTGYHHLNESVVRKGQRVTAGEVIAKMGKSGTNPVGGAVHTHLDVFYAAPGASRNQQWMLDPRGFQRWSSKGAKNPGTGQTWPVGEFVVILAFPKSATALGKEGVDKPLSTTVKVNGAAIALAGRGPNTNVA